MNSLLRAVQAGPGRWPRLDLLNFIPMNSLLRALQAQGNVVILEGDISQDTTLTADKVYVLDGVVFVRKPATLTIEPGTMIFGQPGSVLVIDTGAKIMAEGTPENPIVFTSAQDPGFRSPTDWGGVWINGLSHVNTPGGIETGEAGITGVYGGGASPDLNDSSGVLRYVRIEFAGFPVAPNREINSLTLAGVGAGTVVDHVHCNRGADDGLEFFGGTVNVKYILITGAGDDGFDWQLGYTGKAQFVVVQQDGEVDVEADKGIEADNNENNSLFEPVSHPTLYNFTLIGDPRPGLGSKRGPGIDLRRGTAGDIRNFIVMGYPSAGLEIEGEVSRFRAQNGELTVDNSIFWDNNPVVADDDTLGLLGEHILVVNPLLVDPFNLDNPDFSPAAGSPARNAGLVAQPPDDGFFEPVNFIGGVDPENNWTSADWIRINRN